MSNRLVDPWVTLPIERERRSNSSMREWIDDILTLCVARSGAPRPVMPLDTAREIMRERCVPLPVIARVLDVYVSWRTT